MPTTKISPLTGHEVRVQADAHRDIEIYEDICGRWAVTFEAQWGNATILGGRLQTERGRLIDAQTRRVMALARSEVWRLNHRDGKLPIFMTLSGARNRAAELDPGVPILTVDDMVAAAFQLSLEGKALKTLENLAIIEAEIGVGVEIPYIFPDYPGKPDWDPGQPPKEVGITYGCTDVEAPIIYQLLFKRELIVIHHHETMDDNTRVYLTPDGYAKVDALRGGAESRIQQAFLVCRFTPEFDDIYSAVFKPLGDELKCQVLRIKDIHHIDKIDDRICEEIRRATIVLVDLTDENFNVAFEAGYALALNKPIVWTKRKERDGVKMPFDIYTYNCLVWDPTALEGFREDLKFRMIAALQKAGSGLPTLESVNSWS